LPLPPLGEILPELMEKASRFRELSGRDKHPSSGKHLAARRPLSGSLIEEVTAESVALEELGLCAAHQCAGNVGRVTDVLRKPKDLLRVCRCAVEQSTGNAVPRQRLVQSRPQGDAIACLS
jgi:hypothetical protein